MTKVFTETPPLGMDGNDPSWMKAEDERVLKELQAIAAKGVKADE